MTKQFSAPAMILAAGRGVRMKPLTDSKPKALLKVNGKPLIAYHLEKLAALGIKQVVINVAWLGHLIQQSLGDGSTWGLTIHYCDEGKQALETAGGVINAIPYLADEFWVINADVFSDYCFQALKLKTALAALMLVNNPSFHPNGDFGLSDGWLRTSAKKQFTFSGIGFYSKKFFAGFAQGNRALAPLIRQHADNQAIQAYVYKGLWSDVGTPERLGALQGYTIYKNK